MCIFDFSFAQDNAVDIQKDNAHIYRYKVSCLAAAR
jgi:hypothetical protein